MTTTKKVSRKAALKTVEKELSKADPKKVEKVPEVVPKELSPIALAVKKHGLVAKDGKTYSPEVLKLVNACRAAALKALPDKVKCPKCEKTKPKKSGFGIRTTKNKEGIPTYFALQSYCRICRRKPKKVGPKAASKTEVKS